jgi:hypothetical protein
MRKWITRTAGTVLAGAAALVAVGAGIANADTAGAGRPVSNLWDSALHQAVGPVRYICNDLTTPYGRINPTVCGGLPQSDDDTRVPMTYEAPDNTSARPATDMSSQQQAPRPADPNPLVGADLLRNAEQPLMGGLKNLGVG